MELADKELKTSIVNCLSTSEDVEENMSMLRRHMKDIDFYKEPEFWILVLMLLQAGCVPWRIPLPLPFVG